MITRRALEERNANAFAFIHIGNVVRIRSARKRCSALGQKRTWAQTLTSKHQKNLSAPAQGLNSPKVVEWRLCRNGSNMSMDAMQRFWKCEPYGYVPFPYALHDKLDYFIQ